MWSWGEVYDKIGIFECSLNMIIPAVNFGVFMWCSVRTDSFGLKWTFLELKFLTLRHRLHLSTLDVAACYSCWYLLRNNLTSLSCLSLLPSFPSPCHQQHFYNSFDPSWGLFTSAKSQVFVSFVMCVVFFLLVKQLDLSVSAAKLFSI